MSENSRKYGSKSSGISLIVSQTSLNILIASSLAIVLIWKVVVAADVLSEPELAIGTNIIEAKTFLDTKNVFSWTIITVIFSGISSKLFKLSFKYLPGGRVEDRG